MDDLDGDDDFDPDVSIDDQPSDLDYGTVEIIDEDVPLASNPYTGDTSSAVGLGLAGLGAAAAIAATAKRRKNNNE